MDQKKASPGTKQTCSLLLLLRQHSAQHAAEPFRCSMYHVSYYLNATPSVLLVIECPTTNCVEVREGGDFLHLSMSDCT